ncbi:RNA polymerase subunit sigma, partial [Pseudomonas aeruginosa]
MSLLSVAFDTGQESTSGMHASTSATTAAGSDETLLARYRKGDSAAFEVLYQRH